MNEKIIKAATAGLDFYVRQQVQDGGSADCGRYPYVYNCQENCTETMTTNWTTGVIIESLLIGYQFFKDNAYLESATKGISYLKSLQVLSPYDQQCYGVFREVTPQSAMAHPRDALTAAWALLDYSVITDDTNSFKRAQLYADWFIETGMAEGYPYWTVRFDNAPWEPTWCGSFHSGSAFFMYRLYELTKDDKYAVAMEKILDFYNTHHLNPSGDITVILDRQSHEALDGKVGPLYTNPGWEMMHRYNDDFGALANLAAFKTTGNDSYRKAFDVFIKKMLASQHENGGFGPDEWTVPNAAGIIAVELMAAKQLGIDIDGIDTVLEKCMAYILNLQCHDNKQAEGAFFGLTDDYNVSSIHSNARTGAYSIMALLRYAGAEGTIYFFN